MLEGGGKTPILNPTELEEVGYKIVVYPLSLIGVSIRAMQVRYLHLVFSHTSSVRNVWLMSLMENKHLTTEFNLHNSKYEL